MQNQNFCGKKFVKFFLFFLIRESNYQKEIEQIKNGLISQNCTLFVQYSFYQLTKLKVMKLEKKIEITIKNTH